ncbi:ABC transporter substrate-binding protein [Streptomyces sp. NPDC004539]|uniref:ABC transporter substrate-binding protein n=1 Tax=Streptomyces sp. NPDC004539 TaxID=3154280 RepID=UPI0033B9291E
MSAPRRSPRQTSTAGLSRRRLLTALAALPAAGALSACGSDGSAGDGSVTLDFQWWGSGDRNLATGKAVELFERRHPGIEVSTSFAGYDAYVQRLATQVAAGAGPDIMQIDVAYLRTYADRDVLADLDGPDFTAVARAGIPPLYQRTGLVDGRRVGMPMGIATTALFVDPALWRRAGVGIPRIGWTWDDLLNDIGPKLKRAVPGRAPLTDFGGYVECLHVWLVQRGKSLYIDDGSTGFTKADLLAFWQLMGRLRDKGVFTPPPVTASSLTGASGDRALVRKLSTAEFQITSTATSYWQTYGEVAPVPFPTESSAAPPGMAAAASAALCVRRGSAHRREAATLMDFLLNDPGAADLLGVVRGLPPNQANLDRLTPALTGGDRAIQRYLAEVGGRLAPPLPPAPPGADEDKNEFRRIYQDIIFGKSGVRAAADEMWDKFHTTVPQG